MESAALHADVDDSTSAIARIPCGDITYDAGKSKTTSDDSQWFHLVVR